MSRYAKAGVTIDDLRSKIDKAGGVYDILYCKRSQKICNDLKKIEFDCENVTDPDDEDGGFNMPGFQHGYDMLPNSVAVCWCGAGGDWEDPLALCIYVGDDGSLRAYIPKGGNAYNFKTKAAIGNWCEDDDNEDDASENDDSIDDEDEYDGYHLDEIKHFGLKYSFDMDKLRADAANRIVIK